MSVKCTPGAERKKQGEMALAARVAPFEHRLLIRHRNILSGPASRTKGSVVRKNSRPGRNVTMLRRRQTFRMEFLWSTVCSCHKAHSQNEPE
jgi:hypothetical protein